MNHEEQKITTPQPDDTKRSTSSRSKLLVAAVVLLAAAGLLGIIWAVQQKNKTPNSYASCIAEKGSKIFATSSGSTCTATNGKKFENSQAKTVKLKNYYVDQISFDYRPDWQLRVSNSSPVYKGSTMYQFTSPSDKSFSTTPATTTGNQYLVSSLFQVPASGATNVTCPCTVLAAKSVIFGSSGKRAQLIAVDTNGNKQADSLALAASSVKVGDARVDNYFDYNGKNGLILSARITDSQTPKGPKKVYEVKDAQSWLDSSSVLDLRTVLTSIKLK